MKYNHIIIAILIGLVSFSSFGQTINETVKGNNKFAFEIFKEVFKKDGNVFISPYSISSALAMTYAGARNETEKQMSKVLHFDLNQINTHKGFLKINSKLAKIRSDTTIKLSIANALWNRPIVKEDFLELTKRYYGASVFPLSHAKPINDWAENETNGKIKDIIKESDITPQTDMVLTNAIYFKGDWLKSFDEKDTKKDKFTTIDKKEIDVDMMFQNNEVNYFEDEQYQALELPYKGELISMILILPKSDKSIMNVVNNINSTLFDSNIQNLKKDKVKIYIPKFSFESEFELSDVLKEMGMPDAFDAGKADFSGMGLKGDWIGKVKHKSFIKVNEKGSEAAAATEVTIVWKIAKLHKELIFKADRPFIFLIRDNQTKSILFIGSVVNPNE